MNKLKRPVARKKSKIFGLKRYAQKGWAWTILTPGKTTVLQRTGRNGLGVFDITRAKTGNLVIRTFKACLTISGMRRKLKRVITHQLTA